MAEVKRRSAFTSDEEPQETTEETPENSEINEIEAMFNPLGQQSLFAEVDEAVLESEPYRVVFKYDGGI